jgi:hypothetical protein
LVRFRVSGLRGWMTADARSLSVLEQRLDAQDRDEASVRAGREGSLGSLCWSEDPGGDHPLGDRSLAVFRDASRGVTLARAPAIWPLGGGKPSRRNRRAGNLPLLSGASVGLRAIFTNIEAMPS